MVHADYRIVPLYYVGGAVFQLTVTGGAVSDGSSCNDFVRSVQMCNESTVLCLSNKGLVTYFKQKETAQKNCNWQGRILISASFTCSHGITDSCTVSLSTVLVEFSNGISCAVTYTFQATA